MLKDEFFLWKQKDKVINSDMVKVKKRRENSDSATSLPDDVFSDGFSSP